MGRLELLEMSGWSSLQRLLDNLADERFSKFVTFFWSELHTVKESL